MSNGKNFKRSSYRLRGRCAQAVLALADDPEAMKHFGKWFTEIHMCMPDATPVGPPWSFGPYDTEEIAKKELGKQMKLVGDKLCEIEFGAVGDTRYVDMKTERIMEIKDGELVPSTDGEDPR